MTPENTFRQLDNVGLSDEEIDQVTHLNAIKHFNFDPIAILGRENCTVGALREKARQAGDRHPRKVGRGKFRQNLPTAPGA